MTSGSSIFLLLGLSLGAPSPPAIPFPSLIPLHMTGHLPSHSLGTWISCATLKKARILVPPSNTLVSYGVYSHQTVSLPEEKRIKFLKIFYVSHPFQLANAYVVWNWTKIWKTTKIPFIHALSCVIMRDQHGHVWAMRGHAWATHDRCMVVYFAIFDTMHYPCMIL